jgi:hypothetical protein
MVTIDSEMIHFLPLYNSSYKHHWIVYHLHRLHWQTNYLDCFQTNESIYQSVFGSYLVQNSWNFSLIDFISSLLRISIQIVYIVSASIFSLFVIIFLVHKIRYPLATASVVLDLLLSLMSITSDIGFSISLMNYDINYNDDLFFLIEVIQQDNSTFITLTFCVSLFSSHHYLYAIPQFETVLRFKFWCTIVISPIV